MKNKTVKLILALVLLGVLTGGYFGVKSYVAKQEKLESEEEQGEAVSLLSGNVDELKSVSFIIDKEERTFEKKDDAWTLAGETSFPVDQDQLTNALGAYTSTEADRELTDVENLEEYGLDEPSNTITFTTEEGDETTIRVGMKNDSTSQYYVNKDDEENTVYVVPEASFDPFMNSLYDFAKMDTFPEVDSGNVKKIKIENQDKLLEVEQDSDTGLWEFSDGNATEKADSAKASSLASAISSLEYSEFVDYNCTDESKYGLDKPYAVITVDYQEEEETSSEEETSTENEEETEETETAETETDEEEEEPVLVDKQLVLCVGDEGEEDTRYVKVNDSNEIYTISQEQLSSLTDKESSDFWDLTVSYVSVNDLETLKVERNTDENEINVSRETSENEEGETQETISYEMDGETLEETSFTTFYNKLINMAGQKRLTEEFQPAKDPEMAVTFQKTDGTEVEVEYYEYDSNFYAAKTGEKVFLVNKMTVKEMFSAYESLTVEENSDNGEESSTEGETSSASETESVQEEENS